jgi:hypothetical protein
VNGGWPIPSRVYSSDRHYLLPKAFVSNIPRLAPIRRRRSLAWNCKTNDVIPDSQTDRGEVRGLYSRATQYYPGRNPQILSRCE